MYVCVCVEVREKGGRDGACGWKKECLLYARLLQGKSTRFFFSPCI